MARTRQSLFDILGDRVRGCRFVDLFCSAGGVGIEALSRGAATVLFVDRDRRAVASLRENLERLRVEKDRYRIVRADAVAFLRSGALESFRPHLIFADPPYGKGWARRVWEECLSKGWDRPVLLVVEHRGELPSREGIGRVDRSFGGTVVTLVELGPQEKGGR
jgi:16S rRNA (guanine966-N2)-methyltransferase